MAQKRHLSTARCARLFATLNIAMADTSITIWTAKRFYGSVATEVTWRPVTAIPLARPMAIRTRCPIRTGFRS